LFFGESDFRRKDFFRAKGFLSLAVSEAPTKRAADDRYSLLYERNSMYNPNPPVVSLPEISDEEMAKDHAQILQNYIDTLVIRGFSANTIDASRWFIERWFERHGFVTASGRRPLYVWEAMKPFVGRKRIKEFLLSLSTPGEDDLPVLQASTVRSYASQLQRRFVVYLIFLI
jgi:hypothetical protein